MTSAERLQLIAEREPLPAAAEDLAVRIREAVQAELTHVANDFEARADRLIKMYADIGLEGEREAAAFRTVARDIRNRVEFMK